MNPAFLLSSLAARPEAEAVDAIKFLYQNAFGCGHLLPAEATCAKTIRAEMASILPDAAAPPYEPLGNGLCRLNLRGSLAFAIPPERIAALMLETEMRFQGSPERFRKNLEGLRALTTRYGADIPVEPGLPRLPFTAEALAEAIRRQTASGGPPRHSERYRRAYRPAYRVVLRRYGDALALLAGLERRLVDNGSALIVIDGDCASGKTSLAALLAPLYNGNTIHMDDFFLPANLRTRARLAEPGGNVHYERFKAEALAGLLSGGPFTYGAYSCKTGQTRSVDISPEPVTIIEGSYALHPAFDEAYAKLDAIRVLMTVSPGQQRARILARNGQAMLARFQNEWIPLEKRYFEAYHNARKNQLILSGDTAPEDGEPGKGA